MPKMQEHQEAPADQSYRRELDKLLDLAERLDDTVQRYDFALTSTALLIVFGTPLFFLVVILLLFLISGDTTYKVAGGVAGAIYGIAMLAWGTLRVSRTKNLRDRELRALREVGGVLREVEASLNLSPLERAEVRIRLSRFDIGPMPDQTP